MSGWIKLPRDIVLEPVFQSDQPYCDRAAYIDLLLLANHQTHPLGVGRRILQVQEGEVITSLHKLSKRWNWSKFKVKKFLEMLTALHLANHHSYRTFTRIRLCKWGAYQNGQVTEITAISTTVSTRENTTDQTVKCHSAPTEQTNSRPINNEKNYQNEKNDKKESQAKNLKFVRAKKSYEELSPEEKTLAVECARLYEETLKSKIDFNKLCILVYGSEEDKEPKGFGDWQTLRKALGCLSREKLTHKVLHPYYYIWSLSRQKDFVEKMRQWTGSHCEESR